MKLKTNQCVVAISQSLEGFIMLRWDEDDERVLSYDRLEDNGIEEGWNKGLSPGVWLITFQPFDMIDPGWDGSVKVLETELLWVMGMRCFMSGR